MNLIDDIDGVLTDLRRDTHLVDKRTDVLHRVVRRCIEFMDIKRSLLVESFATLALVTCVKPVLRVKTVDGLCEDTCTGRFTYPSRTAKQIRVRQMVLTNSVLQRLRQCLLAHYRLKGLRPVLSR